jgi:phage terminase large subunit-like protein
MAAMVRHTIATEDPQARIKDVQATRGKAVRAEPISAVYE